MRFILLTLALLLINTTSAKDAGKFLWENESIGIRLPMESEKMLVQTPDGERLDANFTPTRQFIRGLSEDFRLKHNLDPFVASPNVLDQVFAVINKKNGEFMYWIAVERAEDLPLFLSGYLYLSFYQDHKESKEEDETVLKNLPAFYTFFNQYVQPYVGKSFNENRFPFYAALHQGISKKEFLKLFSKESKESKALAGQYYDGLIQMINAWSQREQQEGVPDDVFVQGILMSSFDTTELHKSVHKSLVKLGLHPVGISKTAGVLFANNLDESMRDKHLEEIVGR